MPSLKNESVHANFSREAVRAQLGRVFYRAELEDLVNSWKNQKGLKTDEADLLLSGARKIVADWDNWQGSYLYSYNRTQSIMQILEGICSRKNHYLSHYSALYFNNLVEQRPNDHFITFEKKNKISPKPAKPLNAFSVRQAFLKPARRSNNFFETDGQKIFLLEKHDLNCVGVEKKELRFENETIRFNVTGISRTFIDSIISPHYSGGIGTVASVFRDVDLDANEIYDLYQKIEPIYPYWQTIGLLFQAFGNTSALNIWNTKFRNKPKFPFYLAHEAKSNWIRSDDWEVAYPKGLINL